MQKLKSYLKSRLKGAKRVAVIAVGSDMRGDDAAGLVCAEYIAAIESNRKKKRRGVVIKVFLGGTAPENVSGEIAKFRPTHIILIDTIEIKEKPGTIVLLSPGQIGAGVSFSTHKLPAKILIDYLNDRLHAETIIVGIQPKTLRFGDKMSKVVSSAVKSVARSIIETA